jgi:membrane-associated phospholipid phosphatase
MKYTLLTLWLICANVINADVVDKSKDSLDNSDFWEDGKETLNLMLQGSYLQFTEVNNLYHAAWGVPLTWYGFEHDDRIKNRYGGSEIANLVDHVGDAGVAFNFPILHGAFYYWGKKTGNNHHIQFAKEYFASMYLALLETGLLSYIHVHERPVTGDESFWEEKFRGKSSWPSGHVIPYMTLFFKTMQFYGPEWATIPFVLTVMSSMQRIQDNKHWLSDITASFLLSAWASEGVRKAAGYDKNHPFYRWVFEHDASLGFLRLEDGSLMPRVSWMF